VAAKKLTEAALKTDTAQKVLEAPSMLGASKKLGQKALNAITGNKPEVGKALAETASNAASKHALTGSVAEVVANIAKTVNNAAGAKKESSKEPGQKTEKTATEAASPDTAQPAKKADKLLEDKSTGGAKAEGPDVQGHIKAMKNPEGSIDEKIEKSEEFREQQANSAGVGDFSGLIPNWDGGITTVDIPTYEEIAKWQQEAEAMAAAAALIGAAVAAGIAAAASSSQKQSSGGGGGGQPQPQQYQKSQPACGPC
jgi:hypothetical protein